MSMSRQGRLGLLILGVVTVMVTIAALIFASVSSNADLPLLTGTSQARIVFEAPTDAWVSNTGAEVLYLDGAQWTLATYGYDGPSGVTFVAEVADQGAHTVYQPSGQPDVRVIDGVLYALDGDTWVPTGAEPTTDQLPPTITISDQHDGTWRVQVGDNVSHIAQPAGWDRTPAAAAVDPSGKVVVVAQMGEGGTAVIDTAACRIDGHWALVAVDAKRVLLQVVDSDRLDHSVSAFKRCG